ncbi:hypothetical protein A0H81_14151 [Grifola frondosa]|uniref:Uncharacterized protein n=1 Tax=Grifola frondosa TaxID=5627 RepID=A0A1C7LPM5_GRIFR|nr:hypothetical protein A0H81_14151 [Grifola frondosa]
MAPVGCSDAGASRRTRAPYKSVSTQTTAPPAPMEPPQPTLHLHIANSIHGVTIAIPCASAPSAVASSATVTASQGFALRIEPERVPEPPRRIPGPCDALLRRVSTLPPELPRQEQLFPMPVERGNMGYSIEWRKVMARLDSPDVVRVTSSLERSLLHSFVQIFLFFCEERVTHDYAFEEISKMVRMASTADPQDLDMNLLKIWSKFMRSYMHLPSYYNAEE